MIDPRAMADRLIEAERSRSGIRPFTQTNPFLGTETAYATQALFYGERLAAGERLVGRKLGLTSRVKQLALGIHSPVYGHLTSGMILPFGEPLRLDELISPKVEPELAFLMGREVGEHIGLAEVLAAVEAVMPALEIVDSRYVAPIRLVDSVADNAGAARVVLGAAALPPRELTDLRLLGCVFRHPRGIDTAAGGAAMGHPVAAISWLARQLAGRGQRIQPGQVILSGGLTSSIPLRRNQTFRAEFDRLGSVQVRVA
ncbi:MAG TPA: fumarylacetoacetate hydrolase family protein [Microlunatus sp.]